MLSKKRILFALVTLLSLSSCGPVNYFTRVKKVPREYSLNYCGQSIKAPNTDINKKIWVVYSDRDNNPTYLNPGGKVKMNKVDFLQPFFVIGQKGDYLRVVKYDAEIVSKDMLGGKFTDRKKAEYYGWINKSHLLLSNQSVTDISTGFKNKQVAIISDTLALTNPELFFVKDWIRTFKDLNLSVENVNIPPYEILYTLKTSPDRDKALVARKTEISPDQATTEVLGWIHSSLIDNIGQRLHVNTKTIPDGNFIFRSKKNTDYIKPSEYALEENRRFTSSHKALKYPPVNSWCADNSEELLINTSIPVPVIDQRDNYVFNINGGKIDYNKFKQLEDDLKKINVLFVFEGKEQTIDNFPAMVNVIQNLQPIFENSQDKDNFIFNYGSVISVQDQSSILIKETKLMGDYAKLVESLILEAEQIHTYKPLATHNAWRSVQAAADMVRDKKNETNILVIVGEAGYTDNFNSELVMQIAESNCRILGFQLHGETDNMGNNFVLQIENLINHYAEKEIETKREKIVYADQLRSNNRYRESSKNVYALDFPSKSITQGWILFPEKGSTLPLDVLTNAIDSMVAEVKWDNTNLTNSLHKAFNTVGNHRYKYDSMFLNFYNPKLAINKKFPNHFSQMPIWSIPTQSVTIPNELKKEVNYQLLLTQEELDDLTDFVQLMCINEVDYKYKGWKVKAKKICNCPDDFTDTPSGDIMYDKKGNPIYLPTSKARSALHKLYVSELKTCKLCQISNSTISKYTLAEAQRRITGCPTYNELLEKYTISDLKNKKKITDEQLDELITYIKNKKDLLENHLHNPNKFESNGQTYYWIDQNLLP